jgi:hypothetical protein
LAGDHERLVAAMKAVESPPAAFDDPVKVAERQVAYLLEAESLPRCTSTPAPGAGHDVRARILNRRRAPPRRVDTCFLRPRCGLCARSARQSILGRARPRDWVPIPNLLLPAPADGGRHREGGGLDSRTGRAWVVPGQRGRIGGVSSARGAAACGLCRGNASTALLSS